MYDSGDIIKCKNGKEVIKVEVINVSELKSPVSKFFYHVKNIITDEEFVIDDSDIFQLDIKMPVPAFKIGSKIKYTDDNDVTIETEILEINISFTEDKDEGLQHEIYYTVDNDTLIWEDDILEVDDETT